MISDIAIKAQRIRHALGNLRRTTFPKDGEEIGGCNLVFGPYRCEEGFRIVEFDVTVFDPGQNYNYSKLYFSTEPGHKFDESKVLCFRVIKKDETESIRVLLPENAISSGFILLRIDILPYSKGTAHVDNVRFLPTNDASPASQRARRMALKNWTRAQVEESEAMGRGLLPHQPESLSLELTAGCNLTCPHCSSHGTAEEHRKNNRLQAFDQNMLDHLAASTFPSLTLLNLVGRGEPMMVALPLWNRLIEHLSEHDVLITCVTNGTFIKQRLTSELLPLIDTLTFSIDGMSDDVFSRNRGGLRLSKFMDNLSSYNEQRRSAHLARTPKLGLSWTLMRNNIHQFPDFARLAIKLEADLLYVRHLFVFHEKDRSESLISSPDICNRYLKEGYDILRGYPIKLDAIPLSETRKDNTHEIS
ncbi:radical SAM protein [Pararhodobacter sp. CCB-MM2]|uniref:radical SAM protein n=1 Tax=Pararhodobacter sp. CCB-MM2 TaxID=1786003 RepID=UPI0009F3C678|nr:radical SAM protein [Pararhodobacter sp. CCB-MM2]